MTKLSHTEQQVWQQHILQAQAQGLSLQQYAKQHALKINSLYYWRKVLARKASAKNVSVQPVRFSAVRVAPSVPTGPCVVQLSAQLSLQCAMLPDPQWLAELCRRLEPQP